MSFIRSSIKLVAAISLSVFFLVGCGGGTTRLFSKPIAESTYVTYPEWGPNRVVAVMPFVNVSKDKDAGLKARELFITELYVAGVFKDVVDEGQMVEVMKKLKLRETDNIGKDALKTLGDNLGVQAVIFGTVEEYSERSNKGAQFAVSLRMIDVDTGEILWLGDSSKEGGGSVSEALGLSDGPTIIEVARDVMANLVSDLAGEVKDKKVTGKKAAELARKQQLENLAKAKSSDSGVSNQPAVASPPPAGGSSSAGITPEPIVP
ncbi:MAG: GNA1162 family protein [Nitrospirota bacterium]